MTETMIYLCNWSEVLFRLGAGLFLLAFGLAGMGLVIFAGLQLFKQIERDMSRRNR